ncbi:MAG TPA: type II CAAX endopeptidase family protein [Candidatus Cybelea sp.]|nr:type II CAAX endopeptidase family protein [Candidatus Cybelea sp.]
MKPDERSPGDSAGSGSDASPPSVSPPDAAILSYTSYSVSPNAASEASAQGSGGFPGGFESVPNDLRVPWGWVDLFVLVVIWFGATVLSTVLIAILFASRGIAWHEIQRSPEAMGLFAVADQLVVWTVVLLYLAAQVKVRFDAPFWSTLGWHEFSRAATRRAWVYVGLIAAGVVLSVLVQLASALVPAGGKLPIEAVMENRQAALCLMLLSVLLAPIVEETVFRGYIYPVVGRSFGVSTGIVATGTVFGLLHAEQLWGGWFQIALLVAVGIIFTWVRAATRTVLASYLLHISYNSYIFVGFLLSANGFRSLPH